MWMVLPATGIVELGRRIAAGKRVEEVDDDKMSREHATVRRERKCVRLPTRIESFHQLQPSPFSRRRQARHGGSLSRAGEHQLPAVG